jgi:hypothetical protein
VDQSVLSRLRIETTTATFGLRFGLLFGLPFRAGEFESLREGVMSQSSPAHDIGGVARPNDTKSIEGVGGLNQPDDETNKRLNEIEMMGEEEALGWRIPVDGRGISPAMRYLHCSRTVNQLVIDRNRCVTIYLAVASLLWTATGAFLNIRTDRSPHLMVSLDVIHQWCIPLTAAVLTLLALMVALLLIRIRVGLIYEVAKMNVLLGLPVGRVRRVNPLSVFFIMYMLIALGGGSMTAMCLYHLLHHVDLQNLALILALSIGAMVTFMMVLGYIVAVRWLTDDPRLLDTAGAVRMEGPRPAMGSVLY